MATKRPKDLPAVSTPTAGDFMMLDGGTTRAITIENYGIWRAAVTETLTNKTLTSPSIVTPSIAGAFPLRLRSQGAAAFDLELKNTETLSANHTLTLTLGNADRTLSLSGNFATGGAITLPAVVQGDLIYASASGVMLALSKDAVGSKFVKNSGTTNNPAWSALALTDLPTQAAFTFVGNNTSGAAVPTAVDIPSLTLKASPVSGDGVLIADSAASNAWKRTTVGALASAGSVASYNGRNGAVTALGTDVPLRGYISGLTLSTAGGSNTFGIAIGVATSDDGAVMMALASAYTKTASAWAVGSGNGGIDTGSIAAAWYHVFLIERTDTGVVDVLFSLSPTSPTMPTNYTKKRRIGSMINSAGTAWVSFVQQGNYFLWSTPFKDVNAPGIAVTTAQLWTLSVPTGVQVTAQLNITLDVGSANTLAYISSPDQVDIAASSSQYSLACAPAGIFSAAEFQVRTNTSGQFRTRLNNNTGGPTFEVFTKGWWDAL